MKHSVALTPYIVLIIAAVFVALVMAFTSACAPPSKAEHVARKHRPDYLGQAIVDSQNYRASKR